MKVRNGRRIRFWKDSWVCDKPLSLLYPDLFKMCEQPEITMDMVKNNPCLVSFTRWLVDTWKHDWDEILQMIHELKLADGDDSVC